MGRVVRPGWRMPDVRLVAVGAVLVIAWLGIGYRLVLVQGLQADDYVARGQDQRVRQTDLPAKRGTIYDRDGVELAVSIAALTLVADPSRIDDPKATAQLLAGVVDVDERDLVARLSEVDSRFAFVARRLEREELDRAQQLVADLELEGLYFIEEPKRVYPAGPVAAQVVGFVRDDDGLGLEGLEYRYESMLAGVAGRLIDERDPYGNPIPQGQSIVEPAVPGDDLVLTIDRDIEYVAERALRRALKRTRALAGTVLVLDVQSGEILAMANAPSFDPNDRSSFDPVRFRNRAVSDVYEPGSTLKVVTIAAALEEGLVTPRSTIEVPAQLEIHDKTYTDTGRRRDQELTLAEIVAHSSNIGTILIQADLGNELHHRYLSSFGLGQTVTDELPGEASGSLQPVRDWCESTCGPSTAIGYRVGVTPLQMAAVFSTIANDGVWVEPHIVREILRGDGTAETYDPVRRPVISARTAQTMQRLLQGVVAEGTGERAAVEGYTIGGKTGTTEKFVPGEGYSETDRIASFIGMAPVSDPRIVVAVVLDSPRGELDDGEDLKFGGVSAAPLFAEVAEAVLHQLGVPPDAA